MRISDLLRFSTDNLRRRLGRTVLTVIGVVVGVCAIVVMVSLGIAVSAANEEMIAAWGDLRVIDVRLGSNQSAETPALDDAMVTQFSGMEHVIAATPKYSSSVLNGTLVAGNSNRYQTMYTSFLGVEPEAMEPMEYTLITGRYPQEARSNSTTIEVVVGSDMFFSFFDSSKSENNPNRYRFADYPPYEESGPNATPTNAPQYDENGVLLNPDDFFVDLMNTPITFRMQYGTDSVTGEAQYEEYTLSVVGVLDYTSDFLMDNGIVLPVSSVRKLEQDYYRLSGERPGTSGVSIYGTSTPAGSYDSVSVKVDDVDNMPEVEKAISDLGFQISSMSQERERLQGQVMQTQLMLGGLAAVSLFVAALNIANTMTMAIYERTREIGVMKVLGCKLSYIRTMFLIESGTIGFVGGIIGVIVSFLISAVLNYLPLILSALGITANIDIGSMFGFDSSFGASGMKLSIIEPWLVFLALGFATGVGLLSGFAPANRAMKISSLEAIRHD